MGLDPAQFWELSPREIAAVMEGAASRIRRERNNLAWLAWHSEALARTKRLPQLKSLLVGDGKPSRPQTGEEIKAIAMMWRSVIEMGKPNV